MSIFDFFKVKQIKAERDAWIENYEILKTSLSPEQLELLHLSEQISELHVTKNSLLEQIEQLQIEYGQNITNVQEELKLLKQQYDLKSKDLIDLDEQLLLESFALYEPKYVFVNSSVYKDRLDSIRNNQKEMIKTGTACAGNLNWVVNNNKTEGRKMVNDMIKLSLRSFNNECDACISNVKFNNVVTYQNKIQKSFETLNKLGKIMQVYISDHYLNLKLQELYLAHEYHVKKQEEKEEQKQIREQMREEARLQREIEEARKNIEKEKQHYSNALNKFSKQLDLCKSDEERALVENKMSELTVTLMDIESRLKDVDYREANQRAGYVYIISNIGSFGEGIYKIGMTRRIDPQDRVSELGDASVPFNFDVHAMIFSDDAPKLEAALHREFESRRLNIINKRREFFRVSLKEIQAVIVSNHDNTIEFIPTAAAEEFRESARLKHTAQHARNELLSSFQEAAVSINT
ncbi:DUF4041 domain-containing protein [Paenibacillus radicis (ex Gao et al. 2016)]|uniref:Bacteriophage T5 Orf172 DNA-binding domain-containing protein n=1 Tax=Paenibacillus radicis (ex Gao et al. 2016) TaxID=1737354 RepID=A0A917HDI3_9BACL|nr:DUF4041 domain-containing protein [Paenibacillus radicis (ex Gao et al. 2016)]GGG74533.1 hypothetical protein GCM10010918_33350 [Paenibacillus radicis (ex Gao et al. 2016)]